MKEYKSVVIFKNRILEFYRSSVFLASHADILLARHAIFPPQRLRDEPKECLRGRLLFFSYFSSIISFSFWCIFWTVVF